MQAARSAGSRIFAIRSSGVPIVTFRQAGEESKRFQMSRLKWVTFPEDCPAVVIAWPKIRSPFS